LHRLPLDIRTCEGLRIQQDFPDIVCERVAIPYPKMKQLVSSKKETLHVKRREEMIEPGKPLRHAGVVRVLRFEGRLQVSPVSTRGQSPGRATESPVGPDLPQRLIAIGDQP